MFKKLSIALATLLTFAGQSMASGTGADYSALSTAFDPGTTQIVTIAGVVMGVIAVIFTIRKTLGVAKKSA